MPEFSIFLKVYRGMFKRGEVSCQREVLLSHFYTVDEWQRLFEGCLSFMTCRSNSIVMSKALHSAQSLLHDGMENLIYVGGSMYVCLYIFVMYVYIFVIIVSVINIVYCYQYYHHNHYYHNFIKVQVYDD